MNIEVTPSPELSVSIARQAEIIDVINAKLAAEPRQGFCFIGSPGTGKTYLMQAIRGAILQAADADTRPIVVPIVTLAEWQESHIDRIHGRPVSATHDVISPQFIRRVADSNALFSRGLRLPRGMKPFAFESLHLFIDEFDSQPTVSEFSASKLQTVVNACYENAPRICPGNEQDFLQLVVAMNKTWNEFESAYGTHVARRIAEMCVRIDFDKAAVTEPVPALPGLVPDALDKVVEGIFHAA